MYGLSSVIPFLGWLDEYADGVMAAIEGTIEDVAVIGKKDGTKA
jgi:hypothetical protein